MLANFDLGAYWESQCPGLGWPAIIERPGHSWPIGLRFELGGSSNLSAAWSRAVALYEATFTAEDICVIADSQFSTRTWTPDPKMTLFGFAVDYGARIIGPPRREERIGPSNWDGEEGKFALEWVCQPAKSFDYALILRGITNGYHGIDPYFQGRAFFLAPETGLLFFMYDDRGLDIVADDRAVLAPVYEKFKDWLVDKYTGPADEAFA